MTAGAALRRSARGPFNRSVSMKHVKLYFLLALSNALACQSEDVPSGHFGSGGDGGVPESRAETGGASGIADGALASQGSGDSGSTSACCGERECQPEAVSRCVCEEWEQADCCGAQWDTFCQVTAEEKCEAKRCSTDPLSGDAGTKKGVCCQAGTEAGCSDPSVEECICALVPDCCTDKWDAICAQLVREKHCEPGVRQCVCEEWQQANCCEAAWTGFCAITAEEKCSAEPECG